MKRPEVWCPNDGGWTFVTVTHSLRLVRPERGDGLLALIGLRRHAVARCSACAAPSGVGRHSYVRIRP